MIHATEQREKSESSRERMYRRCQSDSERHSACTMEKKDKKTDMKVTRHGKDAKRCTTSDMDMTQTN